jgi:hypothetical protein
VAGKLGCRGVISAVRPGRLFYITDSVSNRRYLVDTGLAFSIMPWESTDTPSGPSLTAADGRHIPCWGERSCTITIAGVARHWDFLLAGVSFPIIGMDWIFCAITASSWTWRIFASCQARRHRRLSAPLLVCQGLSGLALTPRR